VPDFHPPIIDRPFRATITTPPSKSLTNRALLLASLARGTSTIENVLIADDTAVMLESLSRLGFSIDFSENDRTVRLTSDGHAIPRPHAELHCANSGTTLRFLTSRCAVGRGSYGLDGDRRMRERPVEELLSLLKNLGVRVRSRDRHGYPPLEVMGGALAGGSARYPSAKSSQFLASAVHIAPFARNEVRIDLESPQTSWPYVEMSMRVMDHFGITSELYRDQATGEPRQIIVPQGEYHASDFRIEPDATSASYFLALAAIHAGSSLTANGIGARSLQGDVKFAGLLKRMGAYVRVESDAIYVEGTDELIGIDANLIDMPDLAPTLAAIAVLATSDTTLRGLHTLRYKETDRITALTQELRKLGAETDATDDEIRIHPPERANPARIETYSDHRMAMSFSILGTRIGGLQIADVQCVAKTYPTFVDDLVRVSRAQD
jgi:3-phosphoshikimate 1-carboxyvinyltransferase